MERINVEHNPNGTVSYQDYRVHKFRPDRSKGRRQSDRVVVPNMPMLVSTRKPIAFHIHVNQYLFVAVRVPAYSFSFYFHFNSILLQFIISFTLPFIILS